MPQSGPFAVKGLLAVRLNQLETDGSPICNTDDTGAWDPCPQSLSTARQITAEQTTELRCGDGSVADSERTPAVVNADALTLVMAKQNFEFIIAATGAEPVFDPVVPTRVIGFLDPLTDADPIPTEFNAWARNRSGGSPAGSPYGYKRLVWPYVVWRLGDDAYSAEYATATLIGTATSNSNIWDGTLDDFLANLNNRYRARWDEATIPDAATSPYSASPSGGFYVTPVCGS